MKKLALALLLVFATVQFALADATSDCAAKAIDKNGKPLVGAAKDSFMKKCVDEAKPAAPAAGDCESKAIDKNGKPLAGAAKDAFIKKCKKDQVVKDCEGKAIDKNGKPLAGAAKASFVKKCVADAK